VKWRERERKKRKRDRDGSQDSPLQEAISEFLSQSGVRHIRIDGSTPQGIRQDLCNRFQTDDKV
jgi:SNF2 family DNA or RNA helicase